MKILYIGYLLPKNEYITNKETSFAAGRFELGLTEGLSKQNDVALETLSIEPRVARFPKDILFIKKRTPVISNSFKSTIINYINFPFLKQLTLFFSINKYIRLWYKKNHKIDNQLYILSYNADVPIVQLGMKWNKRVKYFPILSDLPFYNVQRNSLLSKISWKSQIKRIKKLSNAIVLSKHSAIDFRIQNFIVIDGAISDYEKEERVLNLSSNGILYCGALDEYHGSDTLLELCEIDDEHNYYICGRGNEYSKIFESIGKSNVFFYGEVSNEELLEIQKKCSLQLIPHPVKMKQLKYQFPSKLMTCMASGIPVLSTRLPGIGDEYSNYVIYCEDDSAQSLYRSICDYYKMSTLDRETIGRKARLFVQNYKTWDCQANRIVAFLKGKK